MRQLQAVRPQCVAWFVVLAAWVATPFPLPAQGTRRATLTVQWNAETKDSLDVNRSGETARRVKERVVEMLEAKAVLEIPDIDYRRREGVYVLAYLGGSVIGPEYEHMPGGARRRLPETKLVSFNGRGSHSYRLYEWRQEIMLAPCEETTTAQGAGDFDAGRPNPETQVPPSLEILFDADVATVKVYTHAAVSVRGERASSCPREGGPYSRTLDGMGAVFPIELRISPKAPPPWRAEVKRTPTGYTGTARYYKVEQIDGGTRTRTESMSFTLDLGAARAVAAPAPQPPPVTPPTRPMMGPGGRTALRQGHISFTQGGRDARWSLWKGDVISTGPVLAIMLWCTPDGTEAGAGKGVLTLIVGQQGGPPAIAGLSVLSGPAGDASYDPEVGGCTLRLGQSGPAGVEGSATCQRGFDGTAVTKLAFNAKP